MSQRKEKKKNNWDYNKEGMASDTDRLDDVITQNHFAQLAQRFVCSFD